MTNPSPFPDDLPSRLFPLAPEAELDGDTRLAYALVAAMQQDAVLRHEHICVEVQNRVAILEGFVTSPAAVAAASAHAWGTPGMHDVNNRLIPVDE